MSLLKRVFAEGFGCAGGQTCALCLLSGTKTVGYAARIFLHSSISLVQIDHCSLTAVGGASLPRIGVDAKLPLYGVAPCLRFKAPQIDPKSCL